MTPETPPAGAGEQSLVAIDPRAVITELSAAKQYLEHRILLLQHQNVQLADQLEALRKEFESMRAIVSKLPRAQGGQNG